MNVLLSIVLSYLLGSIPFSHLFPKLKGKDVSQSGTKNIGATNALVVAGPLIGFLSWAGDVGKGFLAVYLAQRYFLPYWAVTACGLAAIIGHDFSVFLKFKGGKGIATTGGALIAFDPVFALVVTLFWAMLILIWRYFIPSTIIILACVPIAMLVLGLRIEVVAFGVLALLLALYTHRKDLQRFLSGQELRTGEAVDKFMKK